MARCACVCVLSCFSCIQLCDSIKCSPPGPSSMGSSRQEYWSRLPCPTPGDLPNPEIKPKSLMSPAVAGRFFTLVQTRKPLLHERAFQSTPRGQISIKFFFPFLFYIRVYLMNNVTLISGVQQSDSVMHTCVSILFQILFPIRLLQNIKQSSLCYTVGISGVRT